MWQAWINAILGLWFIIAAFIIAASKSANITNNLIAGIILVILSIWASVRYRGWKNWVVTLIGVWMIIAGFWFPSSYIATVGNDIVAGALIIILSLWARAGTSKVPQPKEDQMTLCSRLSRNLTLSLHQLKAHSIKTNAPFAANMCLSVIYE